MVYPPILLELAAPISVGGPQCGAAIHSATIIRRHVLFMLHFAVKSTRCHDHAPRVSLPLLPPEAAASVGPQSSSLRSPTMLSTTLDAAGPMTRTMFSGAPVTRGSLTKKVGMPAPIHSSHLLFCCSPFTGRSEAA